MASDITLLVLRTALFTSLAIVLLLAGRTLLRRRFGATLAYQAWLIVPLVLVAASLPGRAAPVFMAAPALRQAGELALQAAPQAPAQVDALLIVWIGGMAAGALWFFLGHAAFRRKLGSLNRCGEVYVSSADVGPASVGLLHPKIVVPHDFAQRYSPDEQALVLAHEQTHISRRDAVANLAAAIFQCVFWFNPLTHLGARRFRQDQELACDAAVMRCHPHQRRTYAEALLKCHTGAFAPNAGIHCHWQTHHSTKERLMSLQQTPSGTVRRLAGRCIVALLAVGAVGATLGARAEQAASMPMYSVAMTLDAGGKQSAVRVLTRAGEKFGVASGEWRLEMTLREAQTAGEVWLTGKLFKGAETVSAPTLRTQINEKATIKVGEGDKDIYAVSMTVSPQP